MQKNNSRKILICTLPNASLFEKTPYMEVSLGASLVAGELEREGYQVDYYDLNVGLNFLRREGDFLTKRDGLILSDVNYLNEYLKNPDRKSLFYSWSHKLIDSIKGKNYSYVVSLINIKVIHLYLSKMRLKMIGAKTKIF